MKTKICHTCKRELPATPQYFYRFKHSKDGLKSSCKECQGGKFLPPKEEEPEGYRRCTDCGELFPATEEYFLKYTDKKAGKDRLKHICRACTAKRAKDWRETGNPERYQEYYKDRSKTEAAKEAKMRYRENHPERITAYKLKYRDEHREAIREYDHERRYNPETREKVLRLSKEWRDRNKERVHAYNQKYAKEHPDYFREATHKRNARKKELEASLTVEEWEETKAFFNGECAYCGKKLDNPTQDHVVPLSAGGGYTAGNIVPACKSCNSSKHTNEWLSWYRGYKYYNPEREARIKEYLKSTATPR